MRVYVGGNKGGTGKSTVSIYLLKRLKEMGYRVGFNDLSQNVLGEEMLKEKGITPDPKPEIEIYDLRTGAPLDNGEVNVIVTEVPFLKLDVPCETEEDKLREEMRSASQEVRPKRILVVNKVSPIPEDLEAQARKIKGLESRFDHVVMVPFNGNLFNNRVEGEPCLDVLAEILVGKRGEKFVTPYCEPMFRPPP